MVRRYLSDSDAEEVCTVEGGLAALRVPTMTRYSLRLP